MTLVDERHPPGRPPGRFRGGHADLGMAHGISGPLALLALAMRNGITVSGHADAIGRICQWLDSWRQDGPAGPWWPERVTSAETQAGELTRREPGRPSWCYGTPGIARAPAARRDRAEPIRDAGGSPNTPLAACLSDPAQASLIRDPSVCHGWAGVAATALHAAATPRTCPSALTWSRCWASSSARPQPSLATSVQGSSKAPQESRSPCTA